MFATLTTLPTLSIRREVDRLFDEALSAARPNGEPTLGWLPAADVRETDADYRVSVELPGVDPATVELTVDRGVLTLAGEKPADAREGERVHLRERGHGRFARRFRLPKGLDDAAITAEYAHGVLTVRLPKAALAQPRRIAIAVGTPAVAELGGAPTTELSAGETQG